MPRRSDAAERLLGYFAERQLPEQSQLPPERDLATALGMSRGQLRIGLAKLKARGQVWSRVGRGTFIGREPKQGLRGVLDLSTLSNPRDIMEARIAVEPMLASLAALRGTPNDFARMEKSVRQSRAARDRESFQRSDEAFHSAIAEAAHNPLLLAVYNAINESRKREVWGSLRERTLTTSRRATYIDQHAGCLAAMRDRDPSRAASIMREHLEFISTICDVFGTRSGAAQPPASPRAETPAATAALQAAGRWGKRAPGSPSRPAFAESDS